MSSRPSGSRGTGRVITRKTDGLPSISGYNPDMYPGVSSEFHAAAFRFGHTQIPPGFYLRDGMCRFRTKPVRLCNTFYDASVRSFYFHKS